MRVFSNHREAIKLYGNSLERIGELAKRFTDKYRVDYVEIWKGDEEGTLIEVVNSLAGVQAR